VIEFKNHSGARVSLGLTRPMNIYLPSGSDCTHFYAPCKRRRLSPSKSSLRSRIPRKTLATMQSRSRSPFSFIEGAAEY